MTTLIQVPNSVQYDFHFQNMSKLLWIIIVIKLNIVQYHGK